uniref:Major facilitator superfamily (MFS) profile domain-containing protein n=1 Tax=Guillardia theta TaxID=55529 RepID=A0A7S4H845_GUITH|mmetsp:Transcript_10037/g.33441  ORF Transcript_10037/g.33441 Transcript_10037/m.33441 type:complete len:469 (+) Transcript_10037:47-1453(+)
MQDNDWLCMQDRAEQEDASNQPVDYEDVLEEIGISPAQWAMFITCGLSNAVDALEVMSLSYIIPELQPQYPSSINGSLGASVFCGMLLGGLVGGEAGDEVGRKPVLLASLGLNFVFTLLFALAEPSWALIAARFVTGLGVGASVPSLFCMAAEIAPSSRRGAMVSLVASFWVVGCILTSLLAWLVIPTSGWRIFIASCAAVPFLCFLLVLVLVSESPRFLMKKGRSDEAMEVVRKFAASSSRELGGELGGELGMQQSMISDRVDVWHNLTELVMSERLKLRSLLLSFLWVGISFGWYGLELWVPTLLEKMGVRMCWDAEDKHKCLYQSSLVVSLANVPGLVLVTAFVDGVGRDKMLVGSLLLSSLSVLSILLVDSKVLSGLMFCSFTMFSVMAWNIVDIVSTELFPTSLRGLAMGCFTALGRVSAAAAQVAFASMEPQPSLLLASSLLILSAIASFFLPELSRARLEE